MTKEEMDNVTWLWGPGYVFDFDAVDGEALAEKMAERWEICIYPPRPLLYPGMWLVATPEHYRANSLMAALLLALEGLRAREEGRDPSF